MNPNDLFFDSKGNLNDINFANKAVSRSSEAIGIISKEGIVLAVTKDLHISPVDWLFGRL